MKQDGKSDNMVNLITKEGKWCGGGGLALSLDEGRGRLVDRRGAQVINPNMLYVSSLASFSRI